MRLFLIRHGETVDNVAGLYAGIRDSELTNHGYQQATRLGLHFRNIGLPFTHLFSSHLQRAAQTAGKIRDAQLASAGEDNAVTVVPEVVQLPLLVEKNFGSMEGKKSYQQPAKWKPADKEHDRSGSNGVAGFVAVESKDAMARRADTFLDMHLLPLLDNTQEAVESCVAIVSHGIFLSTLWKRLLLRLPANSVVLSPELKATARPSLEHLGGWSNTGYLELHMTRSAAPNHISTTDVSLLVPLGSPSLPAETLTVKVGLWRIRVTHVSDDSEVAKKGVVEAPTITTEGVPQRSTPHIAHGWRTTILSINSKDHLKGLKRTGGGVGSSRHDASQKRIETFFKRRKVN